MARKRTYYREERRRPVWPDDFEDDYGYEEVEPENPAAVQKVMRGFGWGVLAFMAAGMILMIARPETAAIPRVDDDQSGGYRVVSVSRGRLQAVDMQTGKQVSFADQQLVRQALEGSIKRGDVIYR